LPTSIGVYWHHQKVLVDRAGLGGKVKKWDACDKVLSYGEATTVAA
jgi:hypothetical protein